MKLHQQIALKLPSEPEATRPLLRNCMKNAEIIDSPTACEHDKEAARAQLAKNVAAYERKRNSMVPKNVPLGCD